MWVLLYCIEVVSTHVRLQLVLQGHHSRPVCLNSPAVLHSFRYFIKPWSSWIQTGFEFRETLSLFLLSSLTSRKNEEYWPSYLLSSWLQLRGQHCDHNYSLQGNLRPKLVILIGQQNVRLDNTAVYIQPKTGTVVFQGVSGQHLPTKSSNSAHPHWLT